MKRRLLGGIGANLYGQLVTAVVQLASVPLLIVAWGPARYGQWAVLTALPAALAFADGGLVLASGNAMAMLAARGDTAGAAAMWRRARWRVAGAVGGAWGLALAVIHLTPATWLTAVSAVPDAEARSLLDLLVVITLLGVVGTLPGAALRAGGGYAVGTAAASTMRLAEAAAIVSIALWGGGLAAAAFGWAVVRLGATPLLFVLAHRRVHWLAERGTSPGQLPPLARPALAALMLPACFALGLQGVTLAIGLSQPPEAVAAFVAVRTLCRTLVQAVGLVIHALMPEMSHAAGRGDAAAMTAVLRLGRQTAMLVLLPGWIALLGLGPVIFAAWTAGRLPLPGSVLPIVATATLLHGLWLSRANLLLAVNRQGDYAGAFLLSTFVTVGLAAAAARFAGLPGVAAATLMGEAAMLLHLATLDRSRRPAIVPLAGVLRP